MAALPTMGLYRLGLHGGSTPALAFAVAIVALVIV